MSKFSIVFSLALALISFASSAAERVGDWYVNIPASVFAQMSSSERTCAERATSLFNKNSFKAAAAEWKRFQTEFITTASEDVAAWAAFFYAFSLDKAKERFKAVEMFGEAIELYPDSFASGLALYFRARSHIENGNTTKGIEDLVQFVSNPDFNTHHVAYAAYNTLAWDSLSKGKVQEAISYWTSVKELPSRGNLSIWRSATWQLTLLRCLSNPAAEISAIANNTEVDFERRRVLLREWRRNMWNALTRPNSVVEAYFKKESKKADIKVARNEYLKKMAVAFSKIASPVYKKCDGGDWELLIDDYETVAELMPKNVAKAIERIVTALQATQDKKLRSSRASSFITKLSNNGRNSEARLLLDCITEPERRAWKGAELGWKSRDGKFILENLDFLEKSADPEVVRKAKLDRARCCKELTRDYDTAIKIWNEYPNPPSTLWQIAEAQRLAGRKKIAQGVLDEICGVFPSDAAHAMLRKGDWYAADSDKKSAIACYRKILQHGDWKKSSAASQAHQRLERYGIATGGAVLNEVH
ncbi:MAG: hypothetical protein J6S51_05050 [Kiritimatiellae bacterium]|nr:hypothetical protein [Kiritimatiellia bacterium]